MVRYRSAYSRVLVAGGASGIGLATAKAFALSGAHVIIAGRERAHLSAAADYVGSGAGVRPFDLLDETSIGRLFEEQAPFDHVAVTAAETKTGSIHSLPLDDAYRSMNSKFFGAYRIARAAAITAGGSLTFVSGFLDRRPNAQSVLQGRSMRP